MKTTDLTKDIIFLSKKYNHKYNNRKVQNLLYLFAGLCLINDIEEIHKIDELPSAYPYGPVFPKIYEKYKSIKKTVSIFYKISIKDMEVFRILELTVEHWGKISPEALSNWSHSRNSPFDYVINTLEARWGSVISLDLLRGYFENNVENVLEYVIDGKNIS